MTENTNQTKTTDHLGYGAYADSLWARIRTALDKDTPDGSELGDDPLVVGIFGEWGAGKSFLLKELLKKANGRSKERALWRHRDSKFDLTVPVFFQPWKYEHEPHLLVPLMLHILEALKLALKEGQTPAEKFSQAIEAKWIKLKGSLPAIAKAVESEFSDVVDGVSMALDALQPGLGALMALGAKHAINSAAKPGEIVPTMSSRLRYEDNGRHYFEIHESLKKITRPKRDEGYLENIKLSQNIRINFVLFIDDLDRCLPEKAVGTLELIKTIFNVESFAFVLALDEEIIERGIGHRYSDYTLQGKKPEMPITGFEYLEKIVHLPFRLPALTNHQARQFVRHYEQTLESSAGKRWFDAPSQKASDGTRRKMGLNDKHESEVDPRHQMDLLPIALACFDYYVPRKLIRMVELMHQIAQVAEVRGNPIPREYGQANQAIDPRVVLAMLLLQLFQPDVYRFMRRHGQAFGLLLSAFEMDATTKRSDLPHGAISNAHLCRWVLGGLWDTGQVAPWTQIGSSSGRNAREELIYGLGQAIAAKLLEEDVVRTRASKDSESALAQQIRLPLVALLLEHRDVQRHAFDPLKLFQILAKSLQHSGLPSLAIKFRPYLSLLAEKPKRDEALSANANQVNEDMHLVYEVPSLLVDLFSSNPNIRANVLDLNDIPDGAYLAEQTVKELIDLLNERLCDPEIDKNAVVGHVPSFQKQAVNDRLSLLMSLHHLAPVIAPRNGADFWGFVENAVSLPSYAFNTETQDPKAISDYLDLRSMLHSDDRFDVANFHLYSPLEEEKRKANPLDYFVEIKADRYRLGSEQDKSDNKPTDYDIKSNFYIAPCLTTVDQYAEFVNSDDYAKADWWGTQGAQWLSGAWDEALKKQEDFKKKGLPWWLENRPVAQRKHPMRWREQLKIGARPVHSLTWFEARAYTRWLTAQIKAKNQKWLIRNDKTYECTLPTEAQWEAAARMQDNGKVHAKPWPWSGESADGVAKRANIVSTGISHSSIAGCFAPTEVGLFDMAGNVWEWQNNLYQVAGTDERIKRVQGLDAKPAGAAMNVAEAWENSDLVALRGGSWISDPDDAPVSFRGRYPPDGWGDGIGFRVMLSLAN